MLLRSTKRFFQKTLDSVRSFLSAGGYQKLHKSSSPDSVGGKLELKYGTDQSYNKSSSSIPSNFCRNNDAFSTPPPSVHHHHHHDPVQKIKKKKKNNNENRKIITYEGKRFKNLWENEEGVMMKMRKERGVLVVKKLKELEMMDKTNAEHVLDIQEILHYYSRLTCPAYLDIVESFFMDMYSELLNAAQTSSMTVHAWPSPATLKFYV